MVPGCGVGRDLEAAGVADELIQDADDLLKLGPVAPLLLPAVQHQLVERSGAVHGRGQPVALIHCLDHLGAGGWEGSTTGSGSRGVVWEASFGTSMNSAVTWCSVLQCSCFHTAEGAASLLCSTQLSMRSVDRAGRA